MREGEGEEREPGERTREPRMEAEARKKKKNEGKGWGKKKKQLKTVAGCRDGPVSGRPCERRMSAKANEGMEGEVTGGWQSACLACLSLLPSAIKPVTAGWRLRRRL